MWQLGWLQPVQLHPGLGGPSSRPGLQRALQAPSWHRSWGALLVLQRHCTCEKPCRPGPSLAYSREVQMRQQPDSCVGQILRCVWVVSSEGPASGSQSPNLGQWG